jgi:hypothetical protein
MRTLSRCWSCEYILCGLRSTIMQVFLVGVATTDQSLLYCLGVVKHFRTARPSRYLVYVIQIPAVAWRMGGVCSLLNWCYWHGTTAANSCPPSLRCCRAAAQRPQPIHACCCSAERPQGGYGHAITHCRTVDCLRLCPHMFAMELLSRPRHLFGWWESGTIYR